MTVEQFEKKYNALQKESAAILKDFKPLMKRMKRLARQCFDLQNKVDNDTNLYVKDERMGYRENGWNYEIDFRLRDFDFIMTNIDGIDAVLDNLIYTKFHKKVIKQKK